MDGDDYNMLQPAKNVLKKTPHKNWEFAKSKSHVLAIEKGS